MKKSAGVFITLYLISTISGIICVERNDSCKSINEVCSVDNDCCYRKCSFSLFYFDSYCNDNTNVFSTITSFFSSNVQIGMCSYNEPADAYSERMYRRYGLNAAHTLLPPGTVVEVDLDNKKLMVTINDDPHKDEEVLLKFSKEVAKVLNIQNGKIMPCNLSVPRFQNSQYIKYIKYVLPYISLFLIVFNFY
ncbi:uncharacterized protein LOC112596405 [Melanaphis sacchari]|uniref:uncharacterized protein LOC112596405 n=1 Tax=Melanaphis sacchari TaxID=742174 RepID=UPI000DC13B42|nr:uncharacterized protein LOC112596405 [Melanaphis sacchari]